ncbi:MAG: penicillin-insensitive murein endopeptidase [Bradymonadales bacterium]|nr:penicillin-insensitive murein endopeptidase [Bradymonadales bacterium]
MERDRTDTCTDLEKRAALCRERIAARNGASDGGVRLVLAVLCAILCPHAPSCGANEPACDAESLLAELQSIGVGWQDSVAQTEEPEAWTLEPIEPPPLFDIPYHDILNPARPVQGSRSYGSVSGGILVNSRPLPLDGEACYVLRSHVRRNAHWATDEMLELVERTARRLAERFEGTRLAIGDASLPEGGDIRRHHSHNSGRDIDFAFFIRDRRGRLLNPTGLVRFGASGQTGSQLFDVERNWYLVRTLLVESKGQVQWIFVSRPLIQLMLDHARSIGEPEELIAMAQQVMHQPSDSSPHDDHFHVRLYCSRQDLLEGCLNSAPRWPWASLYEERHQARVEELLSGLAAEEPPGQIQLIDFLVQIDGRSAISPLVALLPDRPAEVQLAILAACRQLRASGVGREVIALYHTSSDPTVRAAALQTAVTLPFAEAADLLAELLADEEPTELPGRPPASRVAAQALLPIQEPAIVPNLIDALGSRDPQTRILAATVLARTTAKQDRVDWGGATANQRRRAIDAWREWYQQNRDLPRETWIRDGFAQAGHPLAEDLHNPDSLYPLVDLTEAEEPLAYLATRMLREITGAPGPPDRLSSRRRKAYWRDMIERQSEADY